jgi:hypothetical protein
MYCGSKSVPSGKTKGSPSACFQKGIGVGLAIANKGSLERGATRANQPQPQVTQPPPPPIQAPPQPALSADIILALKRKGYSVNQNNNKWIVRVGSGDNRKVFGGRQETANEGWMVALRHSLIA